MAYVGVWRRLTTGPVNTPDPRDDPLSAQDKAIFTPFEPYLMRVLTLPWCASTKLAH